MLSLASIATRRASLNGPGRPLAHNSAPLVSYFSVSHPEGEALDPEIIEASTTGLPPASIAIQTPRSRSAGSCVVCQSMAPAALNFFTTR